MVIMIHVVLTYLIILQIVSHLKLDPWKFQMFVLKPYVKNVLTNVLHVLNKLYVVVVQVEDLMFQIVIALMDNMKMNKEAV